ncbi:uncharacterized protein PHACADRAFT_27160 [Phanerochaete carnosa HHB-10118-sp]|uniref:Uncharacterized protein n=1 Tax=Phanerochaete carnosa (strain HHB-10118-sp) TaxID=650164 RepID=K5WI00_PHACS|nr:uncharacterized protein PHACADRAFT_27160 [Phanerochaete carnosa HHB-10118-sp]EKM58744.1 hypothetical protein PHACADRAFT_27160 [Phanerochaete carnosa HHB-10118-sp]
MQKGYTLEADNRQINKAVVLRLNQLSGPLNKYNCLFDSLCEHQWALPLIGDCPSWIRTNSDVDARPPAKPSAEPSEGHLKNAITLCTSSDRSLQSDSDSNLSEDCSWDSTSSAGNSDTESQSGISTSTSLVNMIVNCRVSILSSSRSLSLDTAGSEQQKGEDWLVETVFSLDTEDDIDLYMY